MSKTARTPQSSTSTRKGSAATASTISRPDDHIPEDIAAEVTAATTVVLDTSVLMADPNAYLAFGDADVVIPLTVIDELDRNKTRLDDAGRNARTVLRQLEDLRLAHDGDIATAVDLPEAGTLRIEPNGLRLAEISAHHLDPAAADHRIIAAALGLSHDGRSRVRVVSNDAALRIKAAVLGLTSEEYQHRAIRNTRVPAGWIEGFVSSALIDQLYAGGSVALDELDDYDAAALAELKVNQFLVANPGGKSALARLRPDGRVHLLPRAARTKDVWGLEAKSKEQAFALDLLVDDTVPLVALEGAAGTGKSMLAIAAGLEKTFEQNLYDRMTIVRPVISVGKQDLGFLPGDLEQKLGPWFEAIIDTMVALSGTKQTHRQCRDQLDHWVEQDRLTLESVTYLRGRSLGSTWMVADEVQNLEPAVVRTIVTRLGKGSKGVLIGDTTQIDSPWTSEQSNGLTALVQAFAGEPEFGHVKLTKGERSRIADLASDRL